MQLVLDLYSILTRKTQRRPACLAERQMALVQWPKSSAHPALLRARTLLELLHHIRELTYNSSQFLPTFRSDSSCFKFCYAWHCCDHRGQSKSCQVSEISWAFPAAFIGKSSAGRLSYLLRSTASRTAFFKKIQFRYKLTVVRRSEISLIATWRCHSEVLPISATCSGHCFDWSRRCHAEVIDAQASRSRLFSCI